MPLEIHNEEPEQELKNLKDGLVHAYYKQDDQIDKFERYNKVSIR